MLSVLSCSSVMPIGLRASASAEVCSVHSLGGLEDASSGKTYCSGNARQTTVVAVRCCWAAWVDGGELDNLRHNRSVIYVDSYKTVLTVANWSQHPRITVRTTRHEGRQFSRINHTDTCMS